MDEKTIERVKKMLNLGNNEGATEAERETALRMAYKILAKHNLSLADLPADAPTETREQQDVVISADTWARSLASHISKLFFCKYFYSRTGVSGKDAHYFVGLQSNAITARYMSEYLIRAIKKEAGSRYRSATSPNGRSFCVGATRAIGLRVLDMIAEQVEDATPGTSVALANMREREAEANNSWLAEQGTNVVSSKPRSDNSLRASSFHSGKEFGGTVALNTQVTNSAKDYKRLK